MRTIFFFLMLWIFDVSFAQHLYHIVYLADKDIKNSSVALSSKSINRRLHQKIFLDGTDYPVNPYYVEKMHEIKAPIHVKSRWFNAIILKNCSDSILSIVEQLSFVKNIDTIRDFPLTKSTKLELSKEIAFPLKTPIFYSDFQNNLINGLAFNDLGYDGAGVTIAIMDAGFLGADTIFTSMNVHATYNVVDNNSKVYAYHPHGTYVLSVIATSNRFDFMGIAPSANFILCRTEIGEYESPIEEWNWIVAAEFADSCGSDIITTSLGYNKFSNPLYNHTYAQLDGRTLLITNAAELAFSKGILIVNSAGNEGDKDWFFINAQCDGPNVLCVGAADSTGGAAFFSSRGPTADNRIKPDVLAMGYRVYAIDNNGKLMRNSGTSFSAPIIAGYASCLWQAHPEATNYEILQSIRLGANSYHEPNAAKGYGLANIMKSHSLLSSYTLLKNKSDYFFPNPFNNTINLFLQSLPIGDYQLKIVNSLGKIVFIRKLSIQQNEFIDRIDVDENWSSGIYCIQIINEKQYLSRTMIKK